MLVTPSVEAPTRRAVLRMPHPSLRCLAMASAFSGAILVPHNGVPFRSENSVPHVEQRSTRHRPPPFPVRTETLSRSGWPRSGHSGFTQHSSARGRWNVPATWSDVVDPCGILWLLGAKLARGSPESGNRQENAP